jgi:hypothetical protein
MTLVSLTGSNGDTATVDPAYPPTQLKGGLFDSRHGSMREEVRHGEGQGDGQGGGQGQGGEDTSGLRIIYKNDNYNANDNINNNATGYNNNNDNNNNNNNSNNINNSNNNSNDNNIKFYPTTTTATNTTNTNTSSESRSDFNAYRLSFTAAKKHLSTCDTALVKLQKMTSIQSSNMKVVIHEPEILQR